MSREAVYDAVVTLVAVPWGVGIQFVRAPHVGVIMRGKRREARKVLAEVVKTSFLPFMLTVFVCFCVSATQLLVESYDPSILDDIARSIQESDIGLTPNNDGRCGGSK